MTDDKKKKFNDYFYAEINEYKMKIIELQYKEWKKNGYSDDEIFTIVKKRYANEPYQPIPIEEVILMIKEIVARGKLK